MFYTSSNNFELVQTVAFYQCQVRGFFKLQSECAALFAPPPANALSTEKESRKYILRFFDDSVKFLL